MKLYYAPGACSLAVHIALHETHQRFDAVKVDLRAHTIEGGANYYDISPRGYVPLLELDDGSRHTEAASLLQYIADLDPAQPLIGAVRTPRRLAVVGWVSFVASELHKTLGTLFRPDTPEATRKATLDKVALRLADLNTVLGKQDYLAGEFSVADAYAFTTLNWCGMLKISLEPYPNVTAYLARVGARPAVQAALRAEGLLK